VVVVAQFDQAFKDEVRARNDIVEVISSYVKLERRGSEYAGLCPFHSEKSPSFHVSPEKQVYHCYGCKASGDVFKFVQQQDHFTFYEAVVHLAKRARLALPKEERTTEEEQAYRERRALYDALDLATRFYQNQLFSEAGRVGLDYLIERGLTEESIRQFRIGWAPGYGRLFRALGPRFGPEVLQKAGLVMARREGTGYMDSFYERILFPIADQLGRVIGFGGRILQGNGPKYKNTAESPLFSKRHVLFGISQSREAIRTQNQAILVEGYMDVIMPHQVGIKNVVAPLGTALTDEQCAVLRRQAEQVVVAFDSDTAGQMATLRGLEKLYDAGCDVRILTLPDGKDPDEFIRDHGVDSFQRCVSGALPLIEFKLKLALVRAGGGNAPENKAKAVEAIARVLVDLKNDILREEYVHKVANELATSPLDLPELKQAIDRQMNRLMRQGFQHNSGDSRNNMKVLEPPQPTKSAAPRPAAHMTAADLLWKTERTLLYLILQNPGLQRSVEQCLGPEAFEDTVHRVIFDAARLIEANVPNSSGSRMASLLETLTDSDARLVLTEMATKPLVTANFEEEAGDCIENIKRHRDSRRTEDLLNLIKASEAAGVSVDDAVVLEYTLLQQRLKKAPQN